MLLDSDVYTRLAAEAERRAVPPADLARVLVERGLNGAPDAPATVEQGALVALDRLADLRKRLPRGPEIDASRLVRDGRDELDRRAGL